MKTTSLHLVLLVLFGLIQSQAAIIVPGANGSDGALNITTDTVIDLSQAVTGLWDADNTANAGRGVYDPAKWAIVFKYSSVTVAATKTLTFTNHPSRAPVVWLVSGNVTINGTVSLDGQTAALPPRLSEPGPGGFRGGSGYYGAGVAESAGLGVGGGSLNNGGSFGSSGISGTVPYGNPSMIPLFGGAGGGGGAHTSGGGGAGGGAILVACAASVNITGELRANGGIGGSYQYFGANYVGGNGSGGGIRIVADTLSGSAGIIKALGDGGGRLGGVGRIRLERAVNSNTLTVTPDPSLVTRNGGDVAMLWPPTDAPQVKIVSIGGQTTPADPRAEFGTSGADTVLAQTSSTTVIIETTNVEQASQVMVRGTPRTNGNFTEVAATVSSVVTPIPLVVRWTATLPVNSGYSAVQVKVIRP